MSIRTISRLQEFDAVSEDIIFLNFGKQGEATFGFRLIEIYNRQVSPKFLKWVLTKKSKSIGP